MPEAWFSAPGIEGHVTLERQLAGIEPWLEGEGATVLDLGCAEGLIGQFMLERGWARDVIGIEADQRKVYRSARLARGVRVLRGDLNDLPSCFASLPFQFDVVLALAIAHKLKDPRRFLHSIAGMARRALIVRLPRGHAMEGADLPGLRLVGESLDYPGHPGDGSHAWAGLYRP